MADISFEVKNDALAVIQNLSIDANFDEVKAALTEMISPYQTMVVTEDGIAAAKSDRARIRKVAVGIEDMRKNVKKLYSEPLSVFENRCKELVSICAEGSDNLDRQVKEFEQREADAKIARLREIYENTDAGTVAGDEVREYCPWGMIFNTKWGNKGYSEDAAKGEIAAAMLQTREDLATIRTMEAQDVPALLTEYKRTRDMGAVVRMANTLKQNREAEERRRAEEAEYQAAREKMLNEKSVSTGVTVDMPLETKTNEDIKPTDFRVWADSGQLKALKTFLKVSGIKYGRVPN